MRNLSLRNIARATGGEYFGPEELLDMVVAGVDKDSRGKSACSFLPTGPSACSPRLLEVGHGERLHQSRHTAHTPGLFINCCIP